MSADYQDIMADLCIHASRQAVETMVRICRNAPDPDRAIGMSMAILAAKLLHPVLGNPQANDLFKTVYKDMDVEFSKFIVEIRK